MGVLGLLLVSGAIRRVGSFWVGGILFVVSVAVLCLVCSVWFVLHLLLQISSTDVPVISSHAARWFPVVPCSSEIQNGQGRGGCVSVVRDSFALGGVISPARMVFALFSRCSLFLHVCGKVLTEWRKSSNLATLRLGIVIYRI